MTTPNARLVVAVVVALIVALWLLGRATAADASHFDHHVSRWARLAHCESTHRWHIDDGGLQITNSTWAAYGGRRWSRDAGNAPRRAQVRVAKRIAWYGWGDHAPQGGGAWPYCWSATR